MLNEKAQNLLTSGDFTPTQTLLAAGIKNADTIRWDELELAQADLNDLIGNGSAKIGGEFVHFDLEDATLNASFDFGASVNCSYFRLLLSISEENHEVDCVITWRDKKIDYIDVDTNLELNSPKPPIAMLRKLYTALQRIGIPLLPLVDWVLQLNKYFDCGVVGMEQVVLNPAVLAWLKAPLASDKTMIQHARYVVSTFEGLAAVADREMAGVPFAMELGQSMREKMWLVICQLTATAYGLSFDTQNPLWQLTHAATNDAWYESLQKRFTSTEDCNSAWGRMCASIKRTHRDLNTALKGLI